MRELKLKEVRENEGRKLGENGGGEVAKIWEICGGEVRRNEKRKSSGSDGKRGRGEVGETKEEEIIGGELEIMREEEIR